MSLKKKFLILLGSIAFITLVISTPVQNIGRLGTAYTEAPVTGENLTAKSLNKFLQTWSKFIKTDISLQQLSLIDSSSEEKYPSQVVRWLRINGWNAEHFFYIEQRLREAVTAASLQETIEGNKAILQKMREGDAYDNLQKIISMQQAQLNAVKITPAELELVKSNLYQINQVLEGKAVSQPKK